MAFITVPNSFVSSTTAKAAEVNSNFAAITDGLADGTKDINVNTATIGTLNVTESQNFDSIQLASSTTFKGGQINWAGGQTSFIQASTNGTDLTYNGFDVVSFPTGGSVTVGELTATKTAVVDSLQVTTASTLNGTLEVFGKSFTVQNLVAPKLHFIDVGTEDTTTVGRLLWFGNNSSSSLVQYGSIDCVPEVTSAGTETARLSIVSRSGGADPTFVPLSVWAGNVGIGVGSEPNAKLVINVESGDGVPALNANATAIIDSLQVTTATTLIGVVDMGTRLLMSGATVVTSRGATISDPSGGGTVDSEARTAIDALIDRLQEHGLIS